MNDSQQDQSQKQLNYYSRHSPKDKKYTYFTNSPLTASPSTRRKLNKTFHLSYTPYSKTPNLFFTLKPSELLLNTSRSSILIQDEDNNAILIDQKQEQQDWQAEQVIPNRKKKQTKQHYQQTNPAQDDYQISPFHHQSQIQSINELFSNIRIEEPQQDQTQQIKIDTKRILNKPTQHQFNKEQQRMNRQFTFGQQLLQSIIPNITKQDTINEEYQKQDLQICEQKSEQSQKQTPVSSLIHLANYHEDDSEESMSQQEMQPQIHQTLPVQLQHSKHNNLVLIIDQDGEDQDTFQDYQSPKFNTLQNRGKEMYHNWKSASPQIIIEQDPSDELMAAQPSLMTNSDKKPNIKLTTSTISSRPFGSSILKLGDLLELIPKKLQIYYHEMHRKLVVDQINVEERLQNQQSIINILQMLLQLKKSGFQCQEYLFNNIHDSLSLKIQINKLLILGMVRKLSNNKNI